MCNRCKILFVGDTTFDMYVNAYYKAAMTFDNVESYIMDFGKLNVKSYIKNFFLKIERHFKKGPHVRKINSDLLKFVKEKSIDLVFLYACDIIRAKTVKKLSQNTYVAIYNNDNPFSKYYGKYYWRHVIKSLKYADIVYSYRKSNIRQYLEHGAKRVELLRSYYIKERNFYIENDEINLDVPAVSFIGHYENDGRIDYIMALLDAGVKVGVPVDWKNVNVENDNLIYLDDCHPKYNEILNKTKISIVFLSAINEDTYTRRCFEIPAVKTMMVAPYNEDIATLFEDGKEVVFYRNKDEFVDKIKYYCAHEAERLQIAESGYARLIQDGHEVKDRVEKIIEDFEEYKFGS